MDRVYGFLTKEVGIKYQETVVVGVSGGPDSMALLYLLMELRKELDLFLICAHINHNVRAASKREESFVERFCDNNRIIFERMSIDQYGDDNFHNEARSKRYLYFDKIVKKYGANYLMTAHHGDDLMETVLMRIVRGSTVKGYAGFAKMIDLGSYKIIRPLIYVTKADVLKYNREHHVKFIVDASNRQKKYTRNRYRKYVLPFLKREDNNVHEKFLKYSEMIFAYSDYLERQLDNIINEVYTQQILNLEKFMQLETVLQIKVLNYILEDIYQDDLILIHDKHLELIFKLIKSSKPNSYIHLPNNVKFIKAYNNLSYLKEEEDLHEYEIELSDYVNLPNGMNLEIVKKCDGVNNFVCRLASNEVKLPLYVRNIKVGDRMEVKGMIGRKKIKDIFIDEKIRGRDRQVWPLVLDASERVVWVPGLKKSKFDKSLNEKYDIIIKYY